MSDRKSVTEENEIVTNEDELARREVENGIRQFQLAMDIVKHFVRNEEKPFQLRTSHILQLHEAALQGIHPQAGTFRNSPVTITKSKHLPPEYFFVSEHVTDLCEYVNSHWSDGATSKIHIAAYAMWKLNWIHPFADGNGRTSRVVSYVVLCIGMNSVLPGSPSIPDQISSNKVPYYEALEAADEGLRQRNVVDLNKMEDLISAYLAQQLLAATQQAGGAAQG
jgi:Fic family protein